LNGALRGSWILPFVGFFLVFTAWALAAPYGGPPDETQHAIRAAGVVSGQIAPAPARVTWGRDNDGTGAIQRVPSGLGNLANCWGFDPAKSAACAEPIGGGPLADVPTSAGRYNPVYYAAVGLPLRLWPGWGGLVLTRLISAALSAALLAWAFATLIRWSRYGLMLAALMACATPMVAHLAGAINPNGLEIAAGIALFAGAIPLLLRNPEATTTLTTRSPLIWLVGTSAVLLAVLRALGPLWLLAALFALLVPNSRGYLRRLWGQRLVRWWAGAVVAALAFGVAWVFLAKANEIVAVKAGKYHFGAAQAALIYFQSWDVYLKGMVGIAGWFDIVMPAPLYWVWISAAAALVIFALAVTGWADRWRFLVMFVGGVIVPGLLQVSEANLTGFVTLGRYMQPLLVGAPLLAAFILEWRLLNARQSATMTRLFCLLLLPCHLALLVYGMVRWQRGAYAYPGLGRLNPLAGDWHPPTGSALPVAAMVVGLVLLGWVFWRGPVAAAAVGVPDDATRR
jgi:hypothetical protein